MVLGFLGWQIRGLEGEIKSEKGAAKNCHSWLKSFSVLSCLPAIPRFSNFQRIICVKTRVWPSSVHMWGGSLRLVGWAAEEVIRNSNKQSDFYLNNTFTTNWMSTNTHKRHFVLDSLLVGCRQTFSCLTKLGGNPTYILWERGDTKLWSLAPEPVTKMWIREYRHPYHYKEKRPKTTQNFWVCTEILIFTWQKWTEEILQTTLSYSYAVPIFG